MLRILGEGLCTPMVSCGGMRTAALEILALLGWVCDEGSPCGTPEGEGLSSPTRTFLGLWCQGEDWGFEWAFLIPVAGYPASTV